MLFGFLKFLPIVGALFQSPFDITGKEITRERASMVLYRYLEYEDKSLDECVLKTIDDLDDQLLISSIEFYTKAKGRIKTVIEQKQRERDAKKLLLERSADYIGLTADHIAPTVNNKFKGICKEKWLRKAVQSCAKDQRMLVQNRCYEEMYIDVLNNAARLHAAKNDQTIAAVWAEVCVENELLREQLSRYLGINEESVL